MKAMTDKAKSYELNDKPPLAKTLILSLQHLILFLSGAIVVPIVIANGMGFTGSETSMLVQCTIFTAGLCTILQAFGLGPVGNRLPIVMGPTFMFAVACISIGQQYGYDAVIGATLIGGVAVGIIGRFCINFIKKLFSKVVIASAIMTIGICLFGLSAEYCAGSGLSNYGSSWQSLLVACFTIVLIVVLNNFGRGFTKMASVLISMAVGTVLSVILGLADFSSIADARWVTLPKPFQFGISFRAEAVAFIFILYLINMIEFIGDTTNAAVIATGEQPTKEHLGRGILCDGIGSSLSALFGAQPNISYSGNIGMMSLTKVKSRYVVGMAGILLVVLGFFPKISTLLSLVPVPVVGAASLVTSGMIATSGIRILIDSKPNEDELFIVAISIAIGIGFNYSAGALDNFPFFVSSIIKGVPGASVSAILLSLLLPQKGENSPKH